mgnify:CR=1 FL=1
MNQLIWILLLALFGVYWMVSKGGDTDPPEYDDYYDHDVSGLLEDD